MVTGTLIGKNRLQNHFVCQSVCQKIKSTAHKNGDVDGTCKRSEEWRVIWIEIFAVTSHICMFPKFECLQYYNCMDRRCTFPSFVSEWVVSVFHNGTCFAYDRWTKFHLVLRKNTACGICWTVLMCFQYWFTLVRPIIAGSTVKLLFIVILCQEIFFNLPVRTSKLINIWLTQIYLKSLKSHKHHHSV